MRKTEKVMHLSDPSVKCSLSLR